MCKKFILLTYLILISGLAAVQAQDSYIIVHALNPEGVEIGSIDYLSIFPVLSLVEIFDGGTFIGYGPYDAETHNVPIPIAPGTHTIKAVFNGMVISENVVVDAGETKVLTFTFNRTVFDLINAIESVSTIMSYSFDYDLECSGGPATVITPTGQYAAEFFNCNTDTNLFSSEVSVSISSDAINVTGSGTRPAGLSYVKILNSPFYSWAGDLYVYKQIDFGAPSAFDYWIIQTIWPDLQTGAIVNISEELINPISHWTSNLTPWGFRPFDPEKVGKTYYYFINNKRKYYIEVAAFEAECGIYLYEDVNTEWDGNYINSCEISEKMGLSDVKMSSVPYDLLGTGIYCGGGGPQPPECEFDADDPIWQNEADKMVLPYDEVELRFEFTNTAPNPVSNVRVGFLRNSELIILIKGIEEIGTVPSGGTFTATNIMKIAGTDNNTIMDEIIKTTGLGKLSLESAVKVMVTADECSTPCEFMLSPRDDEGDIVSIQYPRLIDTMDSRPTGDTGNFYLRGDYDFHHPDDLLVRKYAVIASVYQDGIPLENAVFPDDAEHVADNIYHYIDALFGDDYCDEPDSDCTAYFDTDFNIVRRIGVSLIPRPGVDKSQKDEIHICKSQAYLFGSFSRTLGIPARELTICLGRSITKRKAFDFDLEYEQEAAIQVWYAGDWHLYDTFLGIVKSFDAYVGRSSKFIKYRAWHSWDQRSHPFELVQWLGHDFRILKINGEPAINDETEPDEWRFVQEGTRKGFALVLESPVRSYLVDDQGNTTGYIEGSVHEEIPDSYYLSPGSHILTDKSDPSSFWEANETIFVGGSTGPTDYSLVIRGTDDGHYELILAYVHEDGEIDGSTITSDVRKDETHTYKISLGANGEISITPLYTIESQLLIFPPVIQRDMGDWQTMAMLRLREGVTKDQIDLDQPLLLYPGEIEATRQYAVQSGGRWRPRTTIFAFFNKNSLMDAVPADGTVELLVAGQLKTGLWFGGTDTVRIVSGAPWTPWWEYLLDYSD